jgi:FtsP/CotA-like multicopper oxidase with cupredoxin domain
MAVCSHGTYPSQVRFAGSQPKDNPATPMRERATRSFERHFFARRLRFPDGAEHEIWSFEDKRSGRGLPGALIRVTEGDLVHVLVKPSKGAHTIHLHGMEPDPHNDGVGHTSFEVSGEYTYQFRPSVADPADLINQPGSAGTYFYHCHVNTPLHVQMGMFGSLIVDPRPDPTLPAGARRSFADAPPYDVASETLLVPYAVDPRWHRQNQSAGLSGEDAGLNRFDPRHFYMLGGQLARPPRGDVVWSLREMRTTPAGTGLPTLLRVNNATYFPTRLRFTDASGEPAAIAGVIAHDGRAYRETSDPDGSPPVSIRTDRLSFGAAERYDLLVQPEEPGEYRLHLDWYHWVPLTGTQPLATRSVPVYCTPPA